MALVPLADTWHIDFTMVARDLPDEVVVWGFHTEKSPDMDIMMSICQTFWELATWGNAKARVDLERITLKTWNGLKWVTAFQRIFGVPIPGGGSAQLPAQNAVVVTYWTPELGATAGDGSRYNRSYLGYIATTQIATGGLISNAFQTVLVNAWVDFDHRLQSNRDGTQLGRGGFLVTSLQEGMSADAEHVRVGVVVDTQRRRRNQLSEDYAINLFTAI